MRGSISFIASLLPQLKQRKHLLNVLLYLNQCALPYDNDVGFGVEEQEERERLLVDVLDAVAFQ